MQFTVQQSVFNQSLASVSAAISAKPSHAILGNVLIQVYNDTCILTGFDLTFAIKHSFPVQVDVEGEFTLPSYILKNLVSKLDDESITFSLDKKAGTVTIKSSSGEFHIRGLESSEYPNLPDNKADYDIELPLEIFKKGISSTLFATSSEDTKQILTGVCLSKTNDKLDFAATDSHRLAVITLDVDSIIPDFKMVLPNKGLNEILKIINLSKTEKNIHIEVNSETNAFFHIGDYLVITRVFQGTYPAYRQLIPNSFATQGLIDKKTLLNKLGIIGIVADQKNNLIKMDIQEDKLIVSADDQTNSAHERLDIEGVTQSVEIGFNSKYLSDGIRNVPSDKILLNANKPNQPVVFTPENKEVNFVYLVMPVQIVRA